jgi:hypothetical protein
MKKTIAYLMAISLAVFPIVVQAEDLKYDDGGFEDSIALSLTTAPAVEFKAPGDGVYALDSISFHLHQATKDSAVQDIPGGPPMALASEELSPATYPLTLQIWNEAPDSTSENPKYIQGTSIDVDVKDVSGTGMFYSYNLLEKVIFTGSIRVAILLRDDLLDTTKPDPVVLPENPAHLGVDKSSSLPFGQSYKYDSTADPPWASPDPQVNYGIRAAVHFVPTITCQGFLPPLNHQVTMKQGGRTLPLKAKLTDADGALVTARRLASPPLVQLLLGETDLTAKVAPAGKSNKGWMFRNAGKGMWIYNLKTRKDLAPGNYTVLMVTEDMTKYVFGQECVASFMIETPAPKKGKK